MSTHPAKFMCLCLACVQANRPFKHRAMAQVNDALHEAQKERRAYSWHPCFRIITGVAQ